jgi:peptide-methionine (S)-S-oxide reductase
VDSYYLEHEEPDDGIPLAQDRDADGGDRAARAARGDAGARQALRARQPDRAAVPDGLELALFGMGCFWGARRSSGRRRRVHDGGRLCARLTPEPALREVCSGRTGHNEVVRVVFDPAATSYAEMLRIFWENHDPTQGMRQATTSAPSTARGSTSTARAARRPRRVARRLRARLAGAGYGAITTEIVERPEFYYAEDYHQQYLAKNPHGYCGSAARASRARSESTSSEPPGPANPPHLLHAVDEVRAQPARLRRALEPSMRVTISRKISWSSMRARFAPRQ